MKLLHIIGRKNSGKTTLIVDLVEHFCRQGMRVGTIKHTHHHHELDTPGKDSFRHRQAGAAVVGILAPGMTAVFKPVTIDSEAPERYDEILPLFADCELLLVEGHVRSPHQKVEVWRAETGTTPLALEEPSLAAVISDDLPGVPIPVWSRSDLGTLAANILAAAKEV